MTVGGALFFCLARGDYSAARLACPAAAQEGKGKGGGAAPGGTGHSAAEELPFFRCMCAQGPVHCCCGGNSVPCVVAVLRSHGELQGIGLLQARMVLVRASPRLASPVRGLRRRLPCPSPRSAARRRMAARLSNGGEKLRAFQFAVRQNGGVCRATAEAAEVAGHRFQEPGSRAADACNIDAPL